MSGWEPIQDLPENWQDLADTGSAALAEHWQERKKDLEGSEALQNFMGRLRRTIAIETGVLERLYSIDRGVTQLLVERGLDEALIQHGDTDRPAGEVLDIIRDHDEATEGLFQFVKGERELSLSYIKELHQTLTRHQETVEARDESGKRLTVTLVRGDWKKWPNNPTRSDGTAHVYCPPEQVQPQMEQLVAWHTQHLEQGVSPEVEAAWLHHRFTQIHPFQDGNGRVARCLASLVFIHAGWFPLAITRDQRIDYLDALETADISDLTPLVALFARAQQKAFSDAIVMSGDVLEEVKSLDEKIGSLAETIQRRRELFRIARQPRLDAIERAKMQFARACERFKEVGKRLEGSIDGLDVAVECIGPDHDSQMPQDIYLRLAIEMRKRDGQFFNFGTFAAWAKLLVSIDGLDFETLISFYGIGPNPNNGVIVCHAWAYRIFKRNEIDGPITDFSDLEPLTSSAFYINYNEEHAKLANRFEKWLEQAITNGLDYWRGHL